MKAKYYKKTSTGGEYGTGDLVEISEEDAKKLVQNMKKEHKKKKLKKVIEHKEPKKSGEY